MLDRILYYINVMQSCNTTCYKQRNFLTIIHKFVVLTEQGTFMSGSNFMSTPTDLQYFSIASRLEKAVWLTTSFKPCRIDWSFPPCVFRNDLYDDGKLSCCRMYADLRNQQYRQNSLFPHPIEYIPQNIYNKILTNHWCMMPICFNNVTNG